MHKDLGSIPAQFNLGVVVHACSYRRGKRGREGEVGEEEGLDMFHIRREQWLCGFFLKMYLFVFT